MFITFEGPDGCGKTTQIRALFDYLKEQGYPVYLTREPGGTGIGNQIRQVLHDTANVEMLPQTEILLYSASRAQLVGQVILPRLDAGEIVLCDRYADSTLAYQGYGHGLDLETLGAITTFATRNLKPDLTVYLDISVEEGLHRKRVAFETGDAEWNRMDAQETAFHRRVREGYLRMATAEPGRWVIVDAARPVETVQADVRAKVESELEKRRREQSP